MQGIRAIVDGRLCAWLMLCHRGIGVPTSHCDQCGRKARLSLNSPHTRLAWHRGAWCQKSVRATAADDYVGHAATAKLRSSLMLEFAPRRAAPPGHRAPSASPSFAPPARHCRQRQWPCGNHAQESNTRNTAPKGYGRGWSSDSVLGSSYMAQPISLAAQSKTHGWRRRHIDMRHAPALLGPVL